MGCHSLLHRIKQHRNIPSKKNAKGYIKQVSFNEAVEPRAPYTEWSKSERERQIPCINAHVWNLERWYQWSYVQGSNGDRDIKDSVGEGEGGMIWENSIEEYILPYVK